MATNSLFKDLLTSRPNDIYSGTNVNEATQTKLNNWFWYREVCTKDDDKFLHFWHRNINDYYEAYLLKLELELTAIPDFTDYVEAIHTVIKNNGTIIDSHTGTQTKSKTGNDRVDRSGTDRLDRTGTDTMYNTGTDKTENTGTDTIKKTGTDTVSNTGTQTTAQTQDATHKEVALQTPQSQSYSGVSGGQMPSLDWTYVSGQGQTSDNSGTNQRTDNLLNTNNYNTENKETLDTENKRTINTENERVIDTLDVLTKNTQDRTIYNTQDQTTFGDSHTKSDNGENETDSMKSGRNELETSIRSKISDYIGRSIALDWFIKKLEPCFYAIYED